MGMLEHSSDVLNCDEAASLFGTSTDQKLSGSPSPSPPLPAPAKAKRRFTASARRHVLVRLICSPFAAVFKITTCARSGADGDQQATACTVGERGEARRPSLEELLRREAPSDLELGDTKPDTDMDMDPYDSWKERGAIVVFGFAKDDDMSRRAEDEAPLAMSGDQHGAVPGDDEQPQTAIVPVEFDFGVVQPAGLGGGGAPAALSQTTVPVNVERLVLVLAALRARSMALMGSYRGLGDRRATDKAEVFYRRPIPLGRRCRVQHLEESPYL